VITKPKQTVLTTQPIEIRAVKAFKISLRKINTIKYSGKVKHLLSMEIGREYAEEI